MCEMMDVLVNSIGGIISQHICILKSPPCTLYITYKFTCQSDLNKAKKDNKVKMLSYMVIVSDYKFARGLFWERV